MKFSIDRADLFKSLAHVQSVVEKRNTIPVLGNVLIEVDASAIKMTATDMEIAVVEVLSGATIARGGKTTVPAAMLHDIVRKLPDGASIEFDHKGDNAPLSIKSGRYKTTIAVLPADDFPMMTGGNQPHKFSIPASTIVGMISRTRFAISTEDTRYYLCGLYMHCATQDGVAVLRAAATDGHRLALASCPLPDGASSMPGVILPRKTVNELRKLADECSGNVSVALSDTKVTFDFGAVSLTSKLIDGSFPEYERIIPKHNDKTISVRNADLVGAVSRVSAISNDRARAVKLDFVKNGLVVSAAGRDDTAASEELDDTAVEYAGDAVSIGFQSRYLSDVTDQICDTVQFVISDGSGPAIIRDVSMPDVLYILMPMRV